MAAPAVEEIPSIDAFLDELPAIEDFLMIDAADDVMENAPADVEMMDDLLAPEVESPQEEGWARGSWQSYDWGSVAALSRNASEPVDVSESWSDTRWPLDVAPQYSSGETTPNADEIADALDGIARRIRSGELVIDNLRGTPPEAAMAAALAILLKMQG
ncbi:MAG TPA: hypothetical protein VKO87_15655 [Gemmatimonadaceae bacterium]|nr:hypothetical protein [Gemmatimonadaceae bacterium]